MSGLSSRGDGKQSVAGFTLVEVVIALSIFSLIMLGLLSALGTFGASASRLDERTNKSGSAWLVGDFLRATLSQSVQRLKETLPDGSQAVFFRGTADELNWVGRMPARFGIGGLYHFRLSRVRDAGGDSLMLIYSPYVGGDRVQAAHHEARHVLVEGIEAFRLAYQIKPASREEAPLWQAIWEDPERLPARVRIDIAATGRAWGPLFVSISPPDSGGGIRIVSGPVE